MKGLWRIWKECVLEVRSQIPCSPIVLREHTVLLCWQIQVAQSTKMEEWHTFSDKGQFFFCFQDEIQLITV